MENIYKSDATVKDAVGVIDRHENVEVLQRDNNCCEEILFVGKCEDVPIKLIDLKLRFVLCKNGYEKYPKGKGCYKNTPYFEIQIQGGENI